MTEIVWNDASEDEWGRVLAACDRSSFEHAWCYGAASEAIGVRINRGIVMRESAPVGLVQGMTKRFFGLATVTQIIRGALWVAGQTTDDAAAPVMRHLRRRFTKGTLRFVYWIPELADAPTKTTFLRPCLRNGAT